MDRGDSRWSIHRREIVIGDPWFGVECWTVSHPSRQEGQQRPYTVVLQNDSVHVLGLTADRELVFIVQDRVASGRCLEEVAGAIDDGETSEEAARRELEEETGLVPGRLIALGAAANMTHRFVSTSEASNGPSLSHRFLALDLVSGQREDDANEIIEDVITVPFDAAYRSILDDQPIPHVGLRVAANVTQAMILLLGAHPDLLGKVVT